MITKYTYYLDFTTSELLAAKEILKKINGNGIYYYECGDKYEGN